MRQAFVSESLVLTFCLFLELGSLKILTAALGVQLFKGGIRYLSGGAASGFHHHEDAPHKATLSQIKVISAIAPSKDSTGFLSSCAARQQSAKQG